MIFEVAISTTNREKCRKEMAQDNYCLICAEDCKYIGKEAEK